MMKNENIKNFYQSNKHNIISLLLFYSVIFIVRSIGVTALSDFFTSSSNDGLMQMMITLILMTMVIIAFVIDITTLYKRYSKITFIRIFLRFFTGLLFLNAILYRIHAIKLDVIVFHLMFVAVFIVEVISLRMEKQNQALSHDEENDHHHLIKKNILFSIIAMLFLTVFQLDGFVGVVTSILMYCLIIIILVSLKIKNISSSKEVMMIFIWMLITGTTITYLESKDIVINNVYLFGRTTFRSALYLLMFLPMYYHLFEKHNKNVM